MRRLSAPPPAGCRPESRQQSAYGKNRPLPCRTAQNRRYGAVFWEFPPQTAPRRSLSLRPFRYLLRNCKNIPRPSMPPPCCQARYNTIPNRGCNFAEARLRIGIARQSWCNRPQVWKSQNSLDFWKTPIFLHTPRRLGGCKR